MAVGLRPRPGGERAPPLRGAAARRPPGRDGEMAGRQHRWAGRGRGRADRPRGGRRRSPELCRGPSDSWCGAGPAEPASRSQQGRGAATERLFGALPLPAPIWLSRGQARAVSPPQAVLVVWVGSSRTSPPPQLPEVPLLPRLSTWGGGRTESLAWNPTPPHSRATAPWLPPGQVEGLKRAGGGGAESGETEGGAGHSSAPRQGLSVAF